MAYADLNARERRVVDRVAARLSKDLLVGLEEVFQSMQSENRARLEDADRADLPRIMQKLGAGETIPGWGGTTIPTGLLAKVLSGAVGDRKSVFDAVKGRI